eukprot:scaffold148777_cov22-Tisochrysis_lutea.AAC.1
MPDDAKTSDDGWMDKLDPERAGCSISKVCSGVHVERILISLVRQQGANKGQVSRRVSNCVLASTTSIVAKLLQRADGQVSMEPSRA